MDWRWRPYVPVARRKANAKRYAETLAKKQGRPLQPVAILGRKIATTFWGQAWCDNLESYSDFANRLPRGRTYVRNGSVIDLQITPSNIEAIVAGSEIYRVKVDIARLPNAAWNKIRRDCSQAIESLLDLLQGRLSDGVMQRLTRQREGLFPQPKEIKMSCSCPDWAVLCKHVAAVLYGVGARLDEAPEMLFALRGVDHSELVCQAIAGANLEQALGGAAADTLSGADLGEVFGIELDAGHSSARSSKGSARRTLPTARRARATSSAAAKLPSAKKAARERLKGEPGAVGAAPDAIESTPRKPGRTVAKTKSPVARNQPQAKGRVAPRKRRAKSAV